MAGLSVGPPQGSISFMAFFLELVHGINPLWQADLFGSIGQGKALLGIYTVCVQRTIHVIDLAVSHGKLSVG